MPAAPVCIVPNNSDPAPAGGVVCPACGRSDTRVLFTRHPRPGATVRVRSCPCGGRFRTVERVESSRG